MEHYFSSKPKSELNLKLISYMINSIEFKFFTSSSVFSKDRIDKGTDILIRNCRLKKDSRILDIGCGYGAVGIILSKLNPRAKIIMSDINERALELAKKNLKLNNAKAIIIEGNLFENINEEFNVILCNPPQSAGKKLCVKLIQDSIKHLNNGGMLQLVARHNRGGKHLAEIMNEAFGNVRTIAREGGYHVYCSVKE